MNWTRGLAPLLVLLVAGCATFAPGSRDRAERDLWREAHLALGAGNFAAADSAFSRLASTYPDTEEGREAVFFLGEMRLDPRNPGWNTRAAAEHLRRYLARGDTAGQREIHRRPEATTFLELANQLNLPPDQRVAQLQPETEVRTRTVPGPVRVVPGEQAAELSAEVQRLRRELADREETIRRQREELNRIRNTLAPGRRP
ncbi:MAG TPA: hypothetical protein VGR37_10695 [Longimicrobiaceae bacterium]|nr:hypothetical protein [Longimicrobiaceae bacterium]